MDNQQQALVNSLKTADQIFKDCKAEYRILGSVLIVAYTGKLFRKIGDLDILLDENKKEAVFEKLKQQGFNLVKKRWANFSWIEAHKPEYLGLTFLLMGRFTDKYFSYSFLKVFELRMKAEYIKPTTYNYDGISFVGLPIFSAVAGIHQSFLNPKRKLDRQVLGEEIFRSKVRTYSNINVYFLGIKLPFVYDIFSWFANIFGGIRVILGKKYEAWD